MLHNSSDYVPAPSVQIPETSKFYEQQMTNMRSHIGVRWCSNEAWELAHRERERVETRFASTGCALEAAMEKEPQGKRL